MSYIRYNSPYQYLYGKSDDYVYESSKGIEDFGNINNRTIIEILLRLGENNESIILTHLAKRLAENLKIALREKPLTTEQLIDASFEISKKVEEEVQELGERSNK